MLYYCLAHTTYSNMDKMEESTFKNHLYVTSELSLEPFIDKLSEKADSVNIPVQFCINKNKIINKVKDWDVYYWCKQVEYDENKNTIITTEIEIEMVNKHTISI